MTQQLLSPKIAIVEEEPRIVAIQGAPESVGMLVTTERGPVGVATLVQSDEEYQKIFGGYTANTDGGLSAKGYFENGGDGVPTYVTRVVHYSDPTDSTSKTSAQATRTLQTAVLSAVAATALASGSGPYLLAPGDTLSADIDGGGAVAATFAAAAANVTAGNTGPYVLTDGMTLTLKIDGGAVQTVTFRTANFVSIGAATALEVANAINGQITASAASVSGNAPKLTSDKLGTGSHVQVTGGTSNAVLGFSTVQQNGTGNVADITQATAAEVVAALTAAIPSGATFAVDGTTHAPRATSATIGGGSSVTMGGTAASKIGFDLATHVGVGAGALNTLLVKGKTDGSYGNALTDVIGNSSSGDAARFNLTVFKSGRVVENWPDLTMDSTDARYAPTIVNDENTGSNYIVVADQSAPTTPLNARPANGSFAMSGGNDGLSGLVDADYVGATGTNGPTGVRCFDNVADLRLLIAPNRATAVVHNALVNYCEATRFGSCFAILDPPAGQTAAQIVTYVTTTAALYELSEFAAIYWPRVKIANPSTSVFGSSPSLIVAPSALIAGAYVRNDAKQGGVYEAPAGEGWGDLVGVSGVENAYGVGEPEVNDETKRDLVYPKLINPIWGTPVRLMGARTLKDTSNFPTIGERRGVIFIEQSLKAGLNFSSFRKIKSSLLARMDRASRKFLKDQTKLGAFASDDPKAAFLLDFGPGQNTASTAFARTTYGRIGLATAKPNEFTVLRVGQDTRALEAELAA